MKKLWERILPPRGMLFFSILFVLLLTACSPVLAWGDEPKEEVHQTVAFVFENDLFSGKDRGYTNGVVLSFLGAWQERDEVKKIDPLAALFDDLSFLDSFDRQHRRPVTIGQLMVTPEDIMTKEVVVDDLPYAGLLFGRVNYEYRNDRQGEKFGLLLGIVGPSSRAEEVQKIVHKITGSNRPQGWGNQLHDEPAVNVDYEHMWKLYAASSQSRVGYSTDLSAYTGISLGNIVTDVDAGIILRWGLNLLPLPHSVYKGGVASVPDIGNDLLSEWRFFLMAGVELNYTAYSVFLDGNSFGEDSHSVHRVPEQASVYVGFGLAYERFRLNMFMLRGTEKYTEQEGVDGYGSLTVGWVF